MLTLCIIIGHGVISQEDLNIL